MALGGSYEEQRDEWRIRSRNSRNALSGLGQKLHHYSRNQVPDLKWQEDVRIRLAQVIFAAYDHGVRDPERLMRTAITVVKPVYKRPSAGVG